MSQIYYIGQVMWFNGLANILASGHDRFKHDRLYIPYKPSFRLTLDSVIIKRSVFHVDCKCDV